MIWDQGTSRHSTSDLPTGEEYSVDLLDSEPLMSTHVCQRTRAFVPDVPSLSLLSNLRLKTVPLCLYQNRGLVVSTFLSVFGMSPADSPTV